MKEKDGNFKIIANEDYAGIGITKGKVYEFKDGYTRWDGGRKSYCHYEDFEEFIKHNPYVANLFTKSTPPTELTTITIYNTPGSPKVSAVMRRGDTVIKSAKAMYNPNDALEGKPFSLDDGMELAVKRLFGWEEKAKPISLVKEVKRLAKVGEWVKITKNHADDRFKKDEMYKVMREDNGVLYVEHPQGYECSTGFACILSSKYVVLENYHQDTPQPVKFRKAKVGDKIKIVKKKPHYPKVKIGDIFTVTSILGKIGPCIKTDQYYIFYDKDEEYIILNR